MKNEISAIQLQRELNTELYQPYCEAITQRGVEDQLVAGEKQTEQPGRLPIYHHTYDDDTLKRCQPKLEVGRCMFHQDKCNF